VTLKERHLRMHEIGRVRLKETCRERGFDGRVQSVTIRLRADRWFASVCVEREREAVLPRSVEKPTDVVGIDLGLTAVAVIPDGETTRVIEPQRALRKNLARLDRLIVASPESRWAQRTRRK
jgi:putative transposase